MVILSSRWPVRARRMSTSWAVSHSRIRNHRESAGGSGSNQNPLDLIQADGIVGAVVQLSCGRRLVTRDLLGVLNCATVLQVGSDAGSPKRVALCEYHSMCQGHLCIHDACLTSGAPAFGFLCCSHVL
jgi:hypothetical protein